MRRFRRSAAALPELPDDAWLEVFARLDLKTLASVLRVNKQWNAIAMEPRVYVMIGRREFDIDLADAEDARAQLRERVGVGALVGDYFGRWGDVTVNDARISSHSNAMKATYDNFPCWSTTIRVHPTLGRQMLKFYASNAFAEFYSFEFFVWRLFPDDFLNVSCPSEEARQKAQAAAEAGTLVAFLAHRLGDGIWFPGYLVRLGTSCPFSNALPIRYAIREIAASESLTALPTTSPTVEDNDVRVSEFIASDKLNGVASQYLTSWPEQHASIRTSMPKACAAFDLIDAPPELLSAAPSRTPLRHSGARHQRRRS